MLARCFDLGRLTVDRTMASSPPRPWFQRPAVNSVTRCACLNRIRQGALVKSKTKYILILPVFILVLAPLYLIAASLIVRSSLLNYRGGPLSSQQVAAVWAFVGTSFAAGVSLLGLLLTYLHNERTDVLAKDAEDRLRLESVVKGIELIADGAAYSTQAQVAGGLATVVLLGQVPVALAALRPAWKEDAVDPIIACWLIDRVVEEGSAGDIHTASAYLFERASVLVQEADNGVVIVLPNCLEDNWDTNWPTTAKIQFIGALAGAHMAVRPGAWKNGNLVLLKSLVKAVQDPDPYVATTAAKLLRAFAPAAAELEPISEPTQ